MNDTIRSPGAPQVLVVDDEPQILMIMRFALETAGFTVVTATDGAQAWSTFKQRRFDLVVLDLMIPVVSGVAVAERIRGISDVPIMMITALSDEPDRIRGLEAGADDYVTKPFKSKELLARVSTRLRRTNPGAAEHVRAGDLDIDVAGHQVKRGESVISLTPLEFELLVTLARSPWKVFTREELLSQVWGYQHPADTRLVNVHVQRLRAKIEKDPERPSIVVTVRGVGYRVGESA